MPSHPLLPFSDSNLPASFAQRKNLPRIQRRIWIECIVHPPHQRKIRIAEQQSHQLIFLHPDTVLSRQRSAHLDARANDLSSSGNGILKLLRVSRVIQHDRMQVSIAGMKNIADIESVSLPNFLNAL